MLIIAIKDQIAVDTPFIQFFPAKSVDLLKRDLKNVFKQPNSVFASNPEDFDVVCIAEVDEKTGICTPKTDLLFNLAILKDEAQVQ